MTHVNTANRGVRIAAALVAVILGATACGSDRDDSSSIPDVNIAEPSKTNSASNNGDANQVAPAGERETLVEQYTAMKRALSDRVSLATLRVQLSISPEPIAKAVVEPEQPEKPTITKAFKTGWNGFLTVLAAILIFIGYTAPYLVIAAIGAAVLLLISRRRRQLRPEPRSRSIAPPPPPAPVEDPQTSEHDSVGAARNP